MWHDGDCSISRGLESGLQRGPQRSPGEARTANCVVDKQNQNLTAYELEKLGISRFIAYIKFSITTTIGIYHILYQCQFMTLLVLQNFQLKTFVTINLGHVRKNTCALYNAMYNFQFPFTVHIYREKIKYHDMEGC